MCCVKLLCLRDEECVIVCAQTAILREQAQSKLETQLHEKEEELGTIRQKLEQVYSLSITVIFSHNFSCPLLTHSFIYFLFNTA